MALADAFASMQVVFGIPGAKVDAIFDELSDHPQIKLVICEFKSSSPGSFQFAAYLSFGRST